MAISSGAVALVYSYILNAVQRIAPSFHYASALAIFLSLAVFAVIVVAIATAFALLFGWAERKMLARMQSRRGPTYVGRYGLLQNVADLIKLLTKEHIVPDGADRPVFLMMLPLLVALFMLLLFLLPLTRTFVGIGTSIGLIALFALLSLAPLLVFLAGWTSGNKFGSISAQRSAVMLVSYEAPLLLVVAAVALLAHSFSLAAIVGAQARHWFILYMPIGFALFFILMLVETERPPFDLKEADIELVAGWLTDVSAPYYALYLLLDYIRMLVGALLISALFLGGWLGPAALPPYAWMLVKVAVISVFIVVIRATMYRMRLDRAIRLGWAYLLPIAMANLALTFILFVR